MRPKKTTYLIILCTKNDQKKYKVLAKTISDLYIGKEMRNFNTKSFF